MTEEAESTPLLAEESATKDLHEHVLTRLDSAHNRDHIHDEPSCKKARHVSNHLRNASIPSGHGHPLTHVPASPALVLRLSQSFDHGFRKIWSAMMSRMHLPKHEEIAPEVRRRHFVVRAVFFIAVLTMLAMTSISPSLLLFMNDSGFTSADNIKPYVTASAVNTAAPIVSNIFYTIVASRFGPGRALAFGSVMAAVGLMLVMIMRSSLLWFLIGYALYSTCNSFRVIRVSLLSKVVPPDELTTVLATHAVMTPIGALVGPLVWLMAQTYRGRMDITGWFAFDRFSIAYCVTITALVAIVLVSLAFLRHIIPYNAHEGETVDDSGADDGTSGDQYHTAVLHFADGHDQTLDLHAYRNAVFRFFCTIMLGVNMSAGVYMTAFQPILVNVYHTSDAKLGVIFEMIGLFAMIPPLLVAVLSKVLKDRQILLIGLGIKIIGMVLFLPIFGSVREWQVIVGFLLIIKASIFFTTATLSLFTKLLGSMSTSALLGILASASAVGPALAQILVSERILAWFGTWSFALFALPAAGSIVTVLLPRQWSRLDPDREFSTLVTHEAELQHNHH